MLLLSPIEKYLKTLDCLPGAHYPASLTLTKQEKYAFIIMLSVILPFLTLAKNRISVV